MTNDSFPERPAAARESPLAWVTVVAKVARGWYALTEPDGLFVNL